MNIGFTGTQQGMTKAQKDAVFREFLGLDDDPVEVHHGMCVGADEEFEEIVGTVPWKEGRPLIIGHPGVVNGFPKKRSLKSRPDFVVPAKEMLDRNRDIVVVTDELWATPGGFTEELRSGTWSTIRRALRAGKKIRYFWPDGTVTIEEDLEE